MFRNASNLSSLLCFLAYVCSTQVANAQAPTYPSTAKGDVADDYHGQRVADPYRWLEDLGSVDTKAWIDAENATTLPFLERLSQRATLIERLTQLWNYPRTDLPLREAGQIFYRQNTGLQKQSPLYRRASPTAPAQLLLDPNTLSADGSISLAQWQPSPDGRYLAYALSQGGADWADVYVREIATGKDLPGVVRWFRFSGISWTKDSKGFFYARFPEPPRARHSRPISRTTRSGTTAPELRRT
jgi:prolyl oligopeptidase